MIGFRLGLEVRLYAARRASATLYLALALFLTNCIKINVAL
jgi:hypothetical protein